MAATRSGSAGRAVRIGPVGEVHRPAAGQAAPDLLGRERQQWGDGPGDDLQRGVEGVERRGRRRAQRVVGVPEPVSRAADVPVGQHVEEPAHGVARIGDLVGVQLGLDRLDELAQLGQQVAVEHVRRRGGGLCGIPLSRGSRVGVEREEVPGVPQRDHHLAHAVTDARLGDDEVAAAQDRAGHEEPPHRVGAVAVEHLGHVGVVAQRLAHLLPVAAQDDAVGEARRERRPVEDRRGEDVHGVEPAAGLADVLDDEVAREVVLEPVGVLERVVHLGERHRAPSRTTRPGRPRPGASSTARWGRPGWAGSAGRRKAGAGR